MTSGFNLHGQCVDIATAAASLPGATFGNLFLTSCSGTGSTISCATLDGTTSATSSMSFQPAACADTTPITAAWMGYIVFAFFSVFMLRKTLKWFARFLSASDLA